MAFGDWATLLTTFDGVNENPLSEGGNWTNKVITSDGNMQRSSNVATDTGGTCSAWWTPRTFGPDIECYFTVPTKPTDGNLMRLFTRLQSPGTASVDGYLIQMASTAGAADGILIARIDNGAATNIASVGLEWASGNQWGVSAIGGLLTVYRNTGSFWQPVVAVTDSNYLQPGFIGIGCRTGTINDFFGGTVADASPRRSGGWPRFVR